jgi:predicted transposase/invertase (TIGR01784 family)
MKQENNSITTHEKLKDKYIDPFTDFGFKKLFGEECNKELLLDFLNELLHQEEGKIVSITYLKTERLGISEESRKAVFDLYCENENGEKFIVELQKSKQEYFKDRTLYYSTFAITDQAVPGDKWNFKLENVYVVAILNFVLEENNNSDKYKYDVMLTDVETNDIFYKKLKYVYLEMPKFKKKIDELETHFEKWMYVIKNLNSLYDVPDRLQGRIFERIFSAAEIAKLTKEEYKAYIDSLNSYRDYNNTLDYAREEGKIEGRTEGEAIGLEKGEQIGLEKGRTEGEHKKAITIAQNLLKKGISIEDTSEITGLPKQQIETLIKNNTTDRLKF